MKLQRTLEQETKEYTEKSLNCSIAEKLLWNEGGVLFSIVSAKKVKKCLFVTSLEDEKVHLKEIYYKIVEESRQDNSPFIKCESIESKEIISEDGRKGYYVFIVMEAVVPVIEMVLEEKFCGDELNDNQKKIKLLNVIFDACKSAEAIAEKFPEVHMFINNEELCMDEAGNTKLLLFDMIKNDICINNETRELKMIMSRLSKALGLKLKIHCESGELSELKSVCETEKERLEKLEEKYRHKFEQNMEHAQNNNPVAWYNLGFMHEVGRGTGVDYKEAIKWYEKAADKKHIRALNNLAHIYQKGYGVEKDYEKAMEYLLKAAKLGDDMAQFNLGIMYQTGKGLDKDMKKALYWYRKSMKNGNEAAKRMYMRIKNK